MRNTKKSLGINTLLNGLRSMLDVLFPLITFPYVSRILSVNGMGIYNFSNTYVSYFILLAGLGIANYAVREGPKYREDKDKIGTFASQIFTINIVSTIIAYLFLILSLLLFKNLNNYVSCILIFSLQILFTTVGTDWIYTIYEDYSYITVRNIIFKVISILLLFLFVKRSNDYLWYAGITVFAAVGSNILNYIHTKSFINIKLVRNPNWKVHLKPILIIFASSVATTLYVSSDTTILGLLKSNYDVGIYSVSVKIYTILSTLVSGLLTATVPRLSYLYGKNRIGEYKKVLSQVINNISILVLPAAVGAIMLSKEIVLIVAGKKYFNSIFSLQIIIITLIFSIFSIIFNYCVLIPAKRERQVLKNTVITGIINVLLNFIFIPLWSYNGTSVTTVISEIMIVSMDGWASRDIIKSIIISSNFLKNILSSMLGCVGVFVICKLCDYGFNSLVLKTIFSVMLSIPMYVSILYLLKNEVLIALIKRVKLMLNR